MRKSAVMLSAVFLLLMIPASPKFGFVQTSTKVSSPAPHVLIASLSEQVSALVKGKSESSFKSLQSKVEDAAKYLREGNGDGAMQRLAVFQSELRGLSHGPLIDPQTAAGMLATAAAAQQGIEHILTLPIAVIPPPQVCADSSKCVYSHLYVAAPSLFGPVPSGKPDGSFGAPFPRISDAIAKAKADGDCGLVIHVGSGLYIESITVSMPLYIRGTSRSTVIQGSILDYAGYSLGLSDLRIQNSASPGAIVVDGCPSTTQITNVQIVDATRNGVFQRGGAISAAGLTVRATNATPDDRKSGVGVRLSGGVHAVLGSLVLTQNGAAGLIAEGDGTLVYLSSSSVTLNEVNHSFTVDASTAPLTIGSGVVADDHAYVLSEFTTIDRNQFTGLYVRGGATIYQRYSEVSRTSAIGMFAGFNAVNIGSTLQLTAATLASAETVDLVTSDAATTVSAGRVWLAPILLGYWQGDHGTSTDCLHRDGAEYIVPPGGVLFGIDPYHLTLPPCVDCPVPPPPPCVSLPFDCWWCAGT